MTRQTADLHYTGGGSDKVYHLFQDGITLHTAYGRRGSGLAMSFVNYPTEAKAAADFKKKFMEKLSKGYQIAEGISGNIWKTVAIDLAQPGSEQTVTQTIDVLPRGQVTYVTDPRKKAMERVPSGFLPQLLNEISEADAQKYIQDDAWGAQEKKNGRRHTVLWDTNVSVAVGSNKLGFNIPTFITFKKPLMRVELDGEAISSKLYAFDLLQLNQCSLKDLPYLKRFAALIDFHIVYGDSSVEIIPLAIGTKQKQELWDRVKAAGGEGIVFKRLDAPYQAGRPNRLGDQLKVVFWQHTQARVEEVWVDGKSSIKLACYDTQNAKWIPMGKCTVPPNYDMPSEGDFVEIRYKYYYEGGSLFQPQYEGTTDVATKEDTDYMKLLRFTPEE